MGEPLLHPGIVDFITIAKEAGHHVGLITNGTKLTRALSTALVDAGLDYLAISVDGFTRRTYESLRVGARQETVLRNLRDLIEVNAAREAPLRIEINYVVSSRTEQERDAFFREFASLVHRINFNPVSDLGGQFQLPAELVLSGADPRAISRSSADPNPNETLASPLNARVACIHLWNTMFISAEGRAMLCCNDFKHESKLPSVKDRTLLDIWRTEIQEHRRNHVNGRFENEPCRSCRVNAVAFRMPTGERRRIIWNERLARVRAAVPAMMLPASIKKRRRLRDVPFGYLDVPLPDSAVCGRVAVQGWALGYLGRKVERVDVRIDGVPRGAAEWGHFRPDVGELHPGDGHSFCGFSYSLDSLRLSKGQHVIDVFVTENASHSAILGARSITVVN